MANQAYDEATYLWVAERVLSKSARPLRAGEIVDIGIDDGLFEDKDLSKTPQKSMQARLSLEILNNGERSTFIRTSKGRFFLRERATSAVTLDVALLPGRVDQVSVYTAPRRMPPPPTESVLVVPRYAFERVLQFQGIDSDYDHILPVLLSNTTYIPRTEAETTETYKQFVTYVVIQYKDRLLSFRRGSYNRAATFLRGARCIGFGGHVTESDLNLFSMSDSGIKSNAIREISEELNLGLVANRIAQDNFEIVGVLNDDSSDVGRRHLAIVLRYWVDDWEIWKNITRGEASINQLRWAEPNVETIELSQYEYWSQLVMRKLFPSAFSTTPSYRIRRKSVFNHPHIAVVLGEIGSGKSETTRILKEKAGYAEVNSGQVLASLMGIPPVPVTPRSEFQKLANEFIRSRGGPKRLAVALAAASEATGAARVLIDGIRQGETLQCLREVAQLPVGVIYVYTTPDIAFEFYRMREAGHLDTFTFTDFLELAGAPVESEVRYLIREADVVSYNWLGVDAYRRSIGELVDALNLTPSP